MGNCGAAPAKRIPRHGHGGQPEYSGLEKGIYLSSVLVLITTIPIIYITLLPHRRDVTLWR